MKNKSENINGNRVLRYSIRKLSIGVVSVAIGSVFILGVPSSSSVLGIFTPTIVYAADSYHYDDLEEGSDAETHSATASSGILWTRGKIKTVHYGSNWSVKPGGNDNYAEELLRVNAKLNDSKDSIHWKIYAKADVSGVYKGVLRDFTRPYVVMTTSRGLGKPVNIKVTYPGDGKSWGYPEELEKWPSNSRFIYNPNDVNVNGKTYKLLGKDSYMMTEWTGRYRLGVTSPSMDVSKADNIEKHVYYSKYGIVDWLQGASQTNTGTRLYEFDTPINFEELKELGKVPNVDSQFGNWMGWGDRFRNDVDLTNKVWVVVGATSREFGWDSAEPNGTAIYNFSKIATVDVTKLDKDNYTPQGQDQTVDKNSQPNAGDSIANKDDLPKGTNYEWKTPIDTTTPGEKDGVVVVKYPDGSSEEVPVKVTVKDDAEMNTPQG
ncbi:Rib/alpha-like domain-containing protein, partial [Clostridium perfringens]